jgi:hypothetical protein
MSGRQRGHDRWPQQSDIQWDLATAYGEPAHEQTAADALVNRRRTRRRHSAREPNERSLAQNANNKPAADMTPLSNQSRHSLQNWYGNPNLQTKCIGQIYWN